jgi:capsular exopolysaccharide synthesis family protein
MEKIALAVQRALRDATPAQARTAVGPGAAAGFPQPESRTTRITYTRTPTVAVAPRVLEQHRVASVNSDTTADAFKLLRTQILMEMRKNGWQTLAVTSPNKGAGKSTIALNLAISFAQEVDYTSLLVDADLREPDVRRMLELDPGPGVVDYLMGKAPLEDLLIHPDIGHLVVLPGGAPVAISAELMRSPMMAEMVRELRSRYRDRLVVFDVPPILAGADTLALSTYIDATIMIVEERKTRRSDLERSFELLAHSNLIGMVLNKSRLLPEPDPIMRARPSALRRFFGAEG